MHYYLILISGGGVKFGRGDWEGGASEASLMYAPGGSAAASCCTFILREDRLF